MADEESQNFKDSFQEAQQDLVESGEGSDTDVQPDDTGEQSSEPDSSEQETGESEPSDEEQSPPDESQQAESSDEDTPDGEPDEGPVPYDRFKEVVDQKNEFKDEKEELQQAVNYYRTHTQGAKEMVENYLNDGILDEDDIADVAGLNGSQTSNEGDDDSGVDFDEVRNRLQQSLPDDTVDTLMDVIEDTRQSAEKVQKELQGNDEEQSDRQEVAQQFQSKIQQMMENEDDYPHFSEVGEETDDEGFTVMDRIASEHPDVFFLDDYEQPVLDPDKLDTLYDMAVKQTDFDESHNSGQDESGNETNSTKQKKQENAQTAPMEPAESTTSTSPGEVDEENVEDFREAMDLARKQLA